MQENDTTVESNLQICSPLLAQAIDSLVADGVASREKIEKLLNEDLFQQDLFRSLIMEEILIVESLEQLAVRLEQQNKVFQKRADIVNEAFLEKVKYLATRQFLFAKSQIRLLLADYRESWGKRFVFYGASGLLIILSGIGIFHLYRVLGG